MMFLSVIASVAKQSSNGDCGSGLPRQANALLAMTMGECE